ncbi:MAG: class I SAM-dependent methyltransferase [Desulfovibrio sp.]
MGVREHYQELLAEHYDWVFGGFEANARRAAALLGRLELLPRGSGRALDLGCGPGYFAAPLAQAGFAVQALDWEPTLLNALRQRCDGLDVEVVQEDMRNAAQVCAGPVELVVCTGDSLAHLDSPREAAVVVAQCAGLLEPGGRLLLQFRDQARALTGPDRFLLLRSDANRIFSCMLEYGDEHVEVTDLLYEHNAAPDAAWTLRRSAYRKARLTAGQVEAACRAAGLDVELRVNEAGMITLLATKPEALA